MLQAFALPQQWRVKDAEASVYAIGLILRELGWAS